ncbi:sugar-binding transcriptional regulator [Lichenibacterium ramalinae]|uniref:Sugar-binding transcriptional regulator n=1 Tax=Lichenibacterium ramalinae TaxID=2316527 RepID=A0A4Q2RF92_9HYPH|nr:sugar-binding transcriptional regulator [Lichenibacterium ramalinae]RYB05971.1 sugar-binding transcriptional regulator [Lichenibacterium ramalinae]
MAKDTSGGRAGKMPDDPPLAGRRSQRLRLRAAWMYHVEEMTQGAIAEALGVGRVTVVRLLSDAQALHEVRISLSRDIADLTRIERALERRFGLGEAVVAPLSSPTADPTLPIGAATGRMLSDLLRPGMRIGVGWGKTLVAALNAIDERPLPGLAVVSMLGGIAKVLQYNPADFAWQLSRLLQADCFLIPAPAVVDSPETKRALIERCGLGEIFELGRALDAVVMSVGGMGPDNTSYRFGYFSEADRRSLLAAGAVGDLLYQFFDIDGAVLDHPVNARVMAIPSDSILAAPVRVLTSGGPGKVDAMLGAIRLARPTILVTDEVTAAGLLAAAGDPLAAEPA